MDDDSGPRSLKTAATILRALRLLGEHPEGLSPADLGARLGKSSATARYMVNTLVDTGYAVCDPSGRCRLGAAPPWGPWLASAPDISDKAPAADAVLAEAVTELYSRTRLRAYLVRHTGDVANIAAVRGHQGLARIPGLEPQIRPEHAHALGLTKALLAASPTYREAVGNERLTPVTADTITCPLQFDDELDQVVARGWALDEGEFAAGFATVAAPLTTPSGPATAALGISCSVSRLASRRDELIEAVLSVSAQTQLRWGEALTAPRHQGGRGSDDRDADEDVVDTRPGTTGSSSDRRPEHRLRRRGPMRATSHRYAQSGSMSKSDRMTRM